MLRASCFLRSLCVALLLCWAELASSPSAVWSFEPEEDETFLETAPVVEIGPLPSGVTRSLRVTLSDSDRTARAVWKTIDEHEPARRFGAGRVETQFSDSYKHEIAAYELDKLVGFGLVPPTVGRKLQGEQGSMQLWLEGTFTERERIKRGLEPRNPSQWNAQMHKVKLFHRLTYNADYRNTKNILVDSDFRIYVVDNSRAFRPHPRLFSEQSLRRFSRAILERLRGLRRETVTTRLGPWLDQRQIEALLKRRDLIVELAERLIVEKGEPAVLYP
jgi:hypothetical protein